MHQHSRRKAHGKQNAKSGGVQAAACYHQHHIQQHHHAREEHRHSHLQRFQHLLFAPRGREPGRHQPHHQHGQGHRRHAAGLRQHLADRDMRPERVEISDGVFGQQAHHAVDEAGHQLLAEAAAPHEGRHQQVDHVRHDGRGVEVAEIHPDGEHQHHQNGQPHPEDRALRSALAQKRGLHQCEGDPLGDADQMPEQFHAHLSIHCRTAPSIPDRRCGWRRSRCG